MYHFLRTCSEKRRKYICSFEEIQTTLPQFSVCISLPPSVPLCIILSVYACACACVCVCVCVCVFTHMDVCVVRFKPVLHWCRFQFSCHLSSPVVMPVLVTPWCSRCPWALTPL